MEYRVTWVIDVDAADAWEAAEIARAMQVKPGTTATVFTAQGKSLNAVEIDLTERTVDGEPA
jgi:hypothetical protein